MEDNARVTLLLQQWNDGDNDALEELMPLVFSQLHQMARSRFARERKDHTLQPTALINELYLRIAAGSKIDWQNRAHFFAVAADNMRHILVDYARKRSAAKRGDQNNLIPLEDMMDVGDHARLENMDIIALDDAMKRLGQLDQRKEKIVELKFFAGLSVPECAEVLGASERTIIRDWNFARAWLFKELKKPEQTD